MDSGLGENVFRRNPGSFNKRALNQHHKMKEMINMGISMKETVNAYLGRPGEMETKVMGFRCLCINAQRLGNKK